MYIFKKQTWFTAGLLLTLTACGGDGDTAATTTTSVDVFDGAAIGCSVSSGGITATGCTDADTQSLLPTLSGVPQSGAVVASPITTLIVEAAIANDVAVNSVDLGAGAARVLVGPTGPAGLGTVVFNFAPTVNDDMNSSYSLGTVWIDTSAAKPYILVDSSAGAAVWKAFGSAIGTLYAIGDAGPAGGIVFHVTDGGLHGLEAAAVDQAPSEWGCYGSFKGETGTAVGTGEQNTKDIINTCSGETTAASVASAYTAASTAASVAWDYGQRWFLPSKDELNLLYLQQDVVGGFAADFYWSSSRYSAFDAWTQHFDYGVQNANGRKSARYSVRAIRAF